MQKEELEQRCARLRQKLKVWEAAFAQSHEGQKPSQDDVKQDEKIAHRYREYNKIRKHLAKPQAEPAGSHTPRKRPRIDSGTHSISNETPTKRTKALPTSHPSIIDPYDPPISFLLSPNQQRTTLGPTPQKDGQLLGMFDAMSHGSDIGTPRKRTPLKNRENNVLMTPSRRHSPLNKSRERDALRRTQSMGNLDVRETPSIQRIIQSCTPGSRTSVRKLKFDETPAFLRRDSKQSQPMQDNMDKDQSIQWSPFASRLKRQSSGRSLSAIVKGLRDMEEECLDDELEVMRELEGQPSSIPMQSVTNPKIQVEASQPAEMPLGPDRREDTSEEEEDGKTTLGRPLKIFKKKGQKRTTRRVNIRPNNTKWQPEPAWKGEESDAEEAVVEETQPNDTEKDKQTKDSDLEVAADQDFSSSESEKEHKKIKKVRKDLVKKTDAVKLKTKKVSATAHANFRALKIKNRNSKGKGRGRFGRRRG